MELTHPAYTHARISSRRALKPTPSEQTLALSPLYKRCKPSALLFFSQPPPSPINPSRYPLLQKKQRRKTSRCSQQPSLLTSPTSSPADPAPCPSSSWRCTDPPSSPCKPTLSSCQSQTSPCCCKHPAHPLSSQRNPPSIPFIPTPEPINLSPYKQKICCKSAAETAVKQPQICCKTAASKATAAAAADSRSSAETAASKATAAAAADSRSSCRQPQQCRNSSSSSAAVQQPPHCSRSSAAAAAMLRRQATETPFA